MQKPWQKALKRVFVPEAENDPTWQPDPESKLWLDEVAALTDEDVEQLERFEVPPLSQMKVWDEKRQTWVRADKA